MAERPPVQTKALTREKIAHIFKSHELIKAFENMIRDVSVVLPDATIQDREAIEQAQLRADAAYSLAQFATEAAHLAQLAANAAQQLAGQALSAAETAQSTADDHIANTENPHGVTKAQVGLGNVDNTSDMDKPISTEQQAALDLKANLSNTVRLLGISGSAAALTGTTTETTLATVSVPGGAMGANGALRITLLAHYTNSANTKTIRVKLGSDTFLAATLTATQTLQAMVIIRNANSASAQVATPIAMLGALGADAGAPATGTTNTGVNQDLIITGQLTNAAETLTLLGYTIEVIPG